MWWVPKARLDIRSSSHDFGKARVGSSATSLDFTVTNTGTAPARNIGVAVKSDIGDVFSLEQGSLPDILPSGKQLPIKVLFRPNTEGRFHAGFGG